MASLYDKSVTLWGNGLPRQIKALSDRSDTAVMEALHQIMNDLFAPNWTYDAQIAWKIINGRV